MERVTRKLRVFDNSYCESCQGEGSYEVITVDGYYIQECLHEERKVYVHRRHSKEPADTVRMQLDVIHKGLRA